MHVYTQTKHCLNLMAEYGEFESRLRERLLTIAEEINQAKEQGRAALADPSDKIGRALAAQQLKIKQAEKSRVAAMLAGVQQQQSELLLSTFTSDYVNLMRSSTKAGANLSEKQVEAVVNSYQTRIDAGHAVNNLLNDSAEETLDATDYSGTTFLTQDSADSDQMYAQMFGADVAASGIPTAAPIGTHPPPPAAAAAPTAASNAGVLSFPSVPSGAPGSHRRTSSFSGVGAGGIDWMLTSADNSTPNS